MPDCLWSVGRSRKDKTDFGDTKIGRRSPGSKHLLRNDHEGSVRSASLTGCQTYMGPAAINGLAITLSNFFTAPATCCGVEAKEDVPALVRFEDVPQHHRADYSTPRTACDGCVPIPSCCLGRTVLIGKSAAQLSLRSAPHQSQAGQKAEFLKASAAENRVERLL